MSLDIPEKSPIKTESYGTGNGMVSDVDYYEDNKVVISSYDYGTGGKFLIEIVDGKIQVTDLGHD